MSEDKRAYRYTGIEGKYLTFDGKHHRAVKSGEVVQMTDKTAHSFRPRFELVTESAVETDPKVTEIAQEDADLADARTEASALVARNVGDATNKINRTVDVELLELAEEAENEKPKPRAGVLRAISDRIEKILSEE